MANMKLLKVKHLPTRFMAYFRRNQLMFTVSATFILLLLLAVWGAFANQDRNALEAQQRQTSREQITEIQRLSEQIKLLTEENNRLNDRGIFYDKCKLRLFAEWTRTQQPIRITKVEKCLAVFLDDTGGSTPISRTPIADSDGSSTHNPLPTPPSTPNEPEPEPLLNCTIDLLGLHLGCP